MLLWEDWALQMDWTQVFVRSRLCSVKIHIIMSFFWQHMHLFTDMTIYDDPVDLFYIFFLWEGEIFIT